MGTVSVENYITHHYPKIQNYPRLVKKFLFSSLKTLIKESEINEFLEANSHKDGFSFIDAILDYFDIAIKINTKELERVPQFGRVVIIANHPLGALDALALIHVLKDIRSDVKIVANSFLNQLDPLKELLIGVDNINNTITKSTLSNIIDTLNKEQAVIIFPSGEVSRPGRQGIITDGKWKAGFYKMAVKTQSPILPIHIKAKNSKTFYALSMINRSLATAALPREMFNFKGKEISFKIGNQLAYESYHMPNIAPKEAVKIIRKHFFRVAKGKRGLLREQKGICLAEAPNIIKQELKNGTLLGKTSDGKSIILYESSVENSVIKEIGRLREITFRFVGEGSGNRRDIDKYDFYYKHLVIWDEENIEIAGAYRIGDCREIVEVAGVEGLYTSTLFNFSQKFEHYFNNALELGRSFVQPKYWNSRALDYLWQGLGAYVRANKNIRYLFGPVSLSDNFTLQAKSLLVYFYTHYFKPGESLVKHKEPFVIPKEILEYCQSIFCGDNYKEDFKILRAELDFLGYSVPTLYKQYADVCEEGGVLFYDFGLDKEFNDCIDGFIFVDLNYMKAPKRKRYIQK